MERLRPPGESRVAQMGGGCLQKREPQESSNILLAGAWKGAKELGVSKIPS